MQSLNREEIQLVVTTWPAGSPTHTDTRRHMPTHADTGRHVPTHDDTRRQTTTTQLNHNTYNIMSLYNNIILIT